MNALPLLLVLLAQETGGGAAPLLEKGERLFRQGDTAGALAAFQEAVKSDPRDARPQYLTGVALEKKGDAPGATAAYRKAIGLKSDFPEAHNNLGALLLARGDAAGALSPLREAEAAFVEGRPSPWRLVRTRFALARALAATDRAAGIDEAKLALGEAPRDGEAAVRAEIETWIAKK
jgi:Flp pilus assembly protein TadD